MLGEFRMQKFQVSTTGLPLASSESTVFPLCLRRGSKLQTPQRPYHEVGSIYSGLGLMRILEIRNPNHAGNQLGQLGSRIYACESPSKAKPPTANLNPQPHFEIQSFNAKA